MKRRNEKYSDRRILLDMDQDGQGKRERPKRRCSMKCVGNDMKDVDLSEEDAKA